MKRIFNIPTFSMTPEALNHLNSFHRQPACRQLVSFILVAALMFVWPIPGTIALRHLLLVVGLLWFAYLTLKQDTGFWLGDFRRPLIIYMLLSGWLILNAALISPEPGWAFSEIKSQWLTGSLSFLLGGFVAISAMKHPDNRNFILTAIATALLLHVMYTDYFAVTTYLHTGIFPMRVGGLTEGMDKMNYLTNMLMAILMAESLTRLNTDRRLLPINGPILALIVGLTVISTYLEAVRNGSVALLFLFGSVIVLYTIENRVRLNKKALTLGITITVIAITAFATASFKADPRWQSLIATAPIALDTEHNKAWLDSQKYPYPRLSDGSIVSPSNYERIAWMKEGILLVMDHPFGTGFGRTAFGHRLIEKYGEGIRGAHSHSGLLDLAIGAGVPGALMWVVFMGGLVILSIKTYLRIKNPFSLILFFIVTGFFTRMLVDSVIRDHMLQQFLFLVGFLGVATFAQLSRAPLGQGLKEISGDTP